jgi:hypothetical protein
MASALIAVAIVGVMMAYGAHRSSNGTAKGPSSTILAPVTDGHSGNESNCFFGSRRRSSHTKLPEAALRSDPPLERAKTQGRQ